MDKFRALLLSITLALLAIPNADAQDVGKPAPALEAKLLDGSQFSLASESGKVVIVNFWATWCKPCRAEMPALDTYYRMHQSQGLVVLGISIDDPGDEDTVRKVMSAFSYPAALKRDSNFDGYGRIWRVPLTFVIDRHGILRKDGWYGDPGIDGTLLDKVVTPLLQMQ